jgi:hypothetical protein
VSIIPLFALAGGEVGVYRFALRSESDKMVLAPFEANTILTTTGG